MSLLLMNPMPQLAPDYDDLEPPPYGSPYPSSISSRMQVPDSIAVVKDERQDLLLEDLQGEEILKPPMMMDVPDRILVAGQDQHIGERHELNLHLDDPVRATAAASSEDFVGLTTPPHVLTLDDRPFPSLQSARLNDTEGDDMFESGQRTPKYGTKHDLMHNGFMTPRSTGGGFPSDLLATPGDGLLLQDEDTDEMTRLQKQVAKLTRHVVQLESENTNRKARELILYPTIVGYFLFQLAKWFLKSN